MGRYRRKTKYPAKKGRGTPVAAANQERVDEPMVSASSVAELAVDIWKITRRAMKEAGAERTLTACERAGQRIRSLGFEIDMMVGKPYDRNMRVRVVENERGEGERTITECLSPAVYFQGSLVREAEVVTRGE